MNNRLQLLVESGKMIGPKRDYSPDPALEHSQPDEGGRTMPQYGQYGDSIAKIKTSQTVIAWARP